MGLNNANDHIPCGFAQEILKPQKIREKGIEEKILEEIFLKE